ncbi:MAG: hypothetical protein U1E46_14175 [Hyphomicrobiales bacterium]
MRRARLFGWALLATFAMLVGVEMTAESFELSGLAWISPALAVVGHPATPGSVAGVARRTTRRTIRRGAYIAHLPPGCPLGSYYGYSLYYCGGKYYQRSGSGYVIVYF